MANETEFVNGLIVKAPNENAPEYVKAKVSIKREELIAWLQAREGEWINADVKVSQGGKWYVAVDSWKPNQGVAQNQQRSAQREPAPAAATGSDFADDDIPF
jgi:hypothetical protein